LTGSYRDEHLFELKLAYEAWQFTPAQVEQVGERSGRKPLRVVGAEVNSEPGGRRREGFAQTSP
jgi:hypothetical protein